MGGLEINRDRGGVHRAQGGAECVEGSAFEAVMGDQQFAMDSFVAGGNGDVFEGLAFAEGQDGGGPWAFPAAICGFERGDGDAEAFDDFGPLAV